MEGFLFLGHYTDDNEFQQKLSFAAINLLLRQEAKTLLSIDPAVSKRSFETAHCCGCTLDGGWSRLKSSGLTNCSRRFSVKAVSHCCGVTAKRAMPVWQVVRCQNRWECGTHTAGESAFSVAVPTSE